MPDGVTKHLQVAATAVRDNSGELQKWIGAVRDVTEIRRSEDYLRLAIDTIPGLAWSSLPDGHIEHLSATASTRGRLSQPSISANGSAPSARRQEFRGFRTACGTPTRRTGWPSIRTSIACAITLDTRAPMSFGNTITRPSRSGKPRSFGLLCRRRRRRSLRFPVEGQREACQRKFS